MLYTRPSGPQVYNDPEKGFHIEFGPNQLTELDMTKIPEPYASNIKKQIDSGIIVPTAAPCLAKRVLPPEPSVDEEELEDVLTEAGINEYLDTRVADLPDKLDDLSVTMLQQLLAVDTRFTARELYTARIEQLQEAEAEEE